MRLSIVLSFLMLLFFSSFSSFGQSQQKEKNRIILWDVTASMLGSTNSTPPNYGYNLNSNIDAIVREGLIKIINQFPVGNGQFRILPFRTEVLQTILFNNDVRGKVAAINFINSFVIDKRPVGYTNICAALDQAMSLFDVSKENVIYLFTDGNQNTEYKNFGRNCLPSILDKYCLLSKQEENFTYFISLNTMNDIHTDSSCPIKIINVGDVRNHGIVINEIVPVKLITTNSPIYIYLQEKNAQIIRFKTQADGIIPPDVTISGDLEIDSAFPLGVICRVISIDKSYINVEFTLDDYTGRTFNRLKTNFRLDMSAKIMLKCNKSNVSFGNDAVLPVRIIYKEKEKVIINKGYKLKQN